MPPSDGAVAGAAVAAAADGQLEPGLPGKSDDGRDVGRIGDADDDRRPAVDATQDDGSRLVVVGVIGRDHLTVDGGAERWDGDR